jgi:hypothetical protein
LGVRKACLACGINTMFIERERGVLGERRERERERERER